MKEGLKGFFITIIIILLLVTVDYISGKKGYERGFKAGVITALDSISAIATQQLANETISSKFYIQATDTTVFILSPKTIKMK